MKIPPEEYIGEFDRERVPYGFHIHQPFLRYEDRKRAEEIQQYIRNLPEEDKRELDRLCRIFEVY